jgi:uncharacterized protein
MAVIAKYVVVRDGIELEQEFLDRKEAEAYDKMLDAAQSLSELIKQGDLKIDIDPQTIDEISICLARNAPAVTHILKSVKPLNPESKPSRKPKAQAEPTEDGQKPQAAPRSKPKGKAA